MKNEKHREGRKSKLGCEVTRRGFLKTMGSVNFRIILTQDF